MQEHHFDCPENALAFLNKEGFEFKCIAHDMQIYTGKEGTRALLTSSSACTVEIIIPQRKGASCH